MDELIAALQRISRPAQRFTDAPRQVPASIGAADTQIATISTALGQAFAQVSRVAPPQVAEPIELLWRNALRANDGRES